MNCSDLIAPLGFRCKPLRGGFAVYSPFTYGDDGEVLYFLAEETASGMRLTDNCAALMHATGRGVNLTSSRLSKLRQYARGAVRIDDSGEIWATCTADEIARTAPDLVGAMLAVSHMEMQWLPEYRESAFNERVASTLAPVAGDRLKRRYTVTGASGHQLEFPFVVVVGGRPGRYIETVSASAKGFNWQAAYRAFGKMMDIKAAGADDAERYVIIEDDPALSGDLQSALTLLSMASNVVTFSRLHGTTLEQIAA